MTFELYFLSLEIASTFQTDNYSGGQLGEMNIRAVVLNQVFQVCQTISQHHIKAGDPYIRSRVHVVGYDISDVRINHKYTKILSDFFYMMNTSEFKVDTSHLFRDKFHLLCRAHSLLETKTEIKL